MRSDPECVPCLLRRVLFQSRLVEGEDGRGPIKAALQTIVRDFDVVDNSARMATNVHRAAYSELPLKDPYKELKERSDIVAKKLLPKLEEFVDLSENRLEACVLGAIVGNVMDFGAGISIQDPDELLERFQTLLEQGLNINDVATLEKMLSPGNTVLYLFDNCGESVFDRLLIEEIRSRDCKVVGVVKGEPILTDVTMEDALRAGLHEVLDEIVDTGQFAVGIDLRTASEECLKAFDECDIIISKGMANFEALSDEQLGPIFFLMKAKCQPVAKEIGARKDENAALYRSR
ncbi:MAG: damage-control phosphatase, subfamily [Candidatus Methanomethylophilaceae archaeon]|nr:damage-control phosphatase, subfamily [Candidatus Methanomethylophilaceae archaeon]